MIAPVTTGKLRMIPTCGVAIARPPIAQTAAAAPMMTLALVFISPSLSVSNICWWPFQYGSRPICDDPQAIRQLAGKPDISCQEFSKSINCVISMNEPHRVPRDRQKDMAASIPAQMLERFGTFGELLRYLRRRAGLTQTALSIRS